MQARIHLELIFTIFFKKKKRKNQMRIGKLSFEGNNEFKHANTDSF